MRSFEQRGCLAGTLLSRCVTLFDAFFFHGYDVHTQNRCMCSAWWAEPRYKIWHVEQTCINDHGICALLVHILTSRRWFDERRLAAADGGQQGMRQDRVTPGSAYASQRVFTDNR